MNDLELARYLAEVAADMALDHLRRGVDVGLKADGSTVTEADIAIERYLRAFLTRQRPQDAVLGEELGSSGSATRVWLIDPIDGTSNFGSGRTEWGTHVALQSAGEVVLGVITRPTRRLVWWAERGAGAHRGELGRSGSTRLAVSTVARLSDSRVTAWTEQPSLAVTRLKNSARWVEPNLDDVLGVIEGRLEVVIDPSGKPWDHAPAAVLVEEAGGRFSDDHGGRRLDLGEARFSNGLVHAQLEQLLD